MTKIRKNGLKPKKFKVGKTFENAGNAENC